MTDFVLKQLNLELSSVCNYACVGCPQTYMTRPKGHMPLDIFRSIVEEVGDSLDRLYLWNYGEPLLNPKAMTMLEMLRGRRADAFLSTTGFLFQRDQDWSSLTALGELIVSINGLDEATYAHHQEGGTLAGVLNGLPKIGEIMAAAKTRYVLQFVAHRHNLHQISELETFARRYGFKQVCVKTFSVMDGQESTFRDFVPDAAEFSRYSLSSPVTRKDPCRYWLVINHDGTVLPCCYDYNSEISLGRAQDGILNVWHSVFVREHLARIARGEYYRFCDACTRTATVFRKNV